MSFLCKIYLSPSLFFLTSRKFIYLLFSHLTFIGVWHHELSHALFGFLSGAKIHKITLFKVEGNTLGSVESSPRGPYLMQGLQMALISIGPVVMGFVTLYLLRTYAYDLRPEMWYKAIMIYLMISIFLQMSLSPQDIKVFAKGYLMIALLVFVICLITKFDVFDLYANLYNKIINKSW